MQFIRSRECVTQAHACWIQLSLKHRYNMQTCFDILYADMFCLHAGACYYIKITCYKMKMTWNENDMLQNEDDMLQHEYDMLQHDMLYVNMSQSMWHNCHMENVTVTGKMCMTVGGHIKNATVEYRAIIMYHYLSGQINECLEAVPSKYIVH